MNTQIIPTASLRERLSAGTPQFLDVRLEEDFNAAHIPGARNNCVFEVAFSERLAACAPDKAAPVIVTGSAADSHESRLAAAKLDRLGYQHILDHREGLAGWRAARHGLETGPPLPAVPPAPHGHFEIDLAESKIEWSGRNLLNKHRGHVGLKAGHLEFNEGILTGGAFVIDLTDLHCDDLQGPIHDVLIAHLQSDDFFDVARHPEARFEILGSEPINDRNPSGPNLRINGEFTLRGETNPLRIDATTGLTPEGKPAAQATLALDRTLWGSIYGSARFFQRIGMHLVNDFIDLQLRIVGA